MNLNNESKQKLETLTAAVRAQAEAAFAKFEAAGFKTTWGKERYSGNMSIQITKGNYIASLDFWVGFPGGRTFSPPTVEVRPNVPYGVLSRSPSRITAPTLPQARFDKLVQTLIDTYTPWAAKTSKQNQDRLDTAEGEAAIKARFNAEGLEKSTAWITPLTGTAKGRYDYQVRLYALTLDQIVAIEKVLAKARK